MGTKNNPGKYDCYANAEPDEPMFVLLGRDEHAPMLVELWAKMRKLHDDDPNEEKIEEAIACAEAMRSFRLAREKGRQAAAIRAMMASGTERCMPDE